MFIESLRLYQFRNLKDQTVRFAEGANFLFGQNGQGKSNFVEAVSLLSQGRSFRTSHLKELIAWGKHEGSIFASIRGSDATFELGVSITGESRAAYLNGQKIDYIGAFFGKLLAVCFSPSDLALVRGAPQERRRFIDKHLVDFRPLLVSTVVEYHRALRSKNALLKAGVRDARQIDVWNEILADRGLKIYGARQEFLRQLQEKASILYRSFSEHDGELEFRLKTNLGSEDHESLTVEQVMHRLREVQEREIQQGSSLLGPHRDDVIIDLGSRSARSFASQGQARSIVLSMKLAVIELIEERRSESPVVLLDDVESELDTHRRERLLGLIFGRPRQVFMTGTERPQEAQFRDLLHSTLQIRAGDIVSE